jgi:hypothetical protein
MNPGNIDSTSAGFAALWQDDSGLRGRRQWRCFGFALGALLAVLIASGPGQVARTQFRMLLTGRGGGMAQLAKATALRTDEHSTVGAWQRSITHGPDSVREQYITQEKQADDIATQVAYALTDHSAITGRYYLALHAQKPNRDVYRHLNDAGLNDLQVLLPGLHHDTSLHTVVTNAMINQRPDSVTSRQEGRAGVPSPSLGLRDSPLVCAAFLRLAVGELVHIDRPIRQKLIDQGETNNHEDVCMNGANIVADALEAAQRGAKVDPNNAFFPMMQAVIHLAVNRDREAYADLGSAATKTYWDDYTGQMVLGLWRMNELRYGLSDARSRYYALAIELPSLQEELERAAQEIVGHAADLEFEGRADVGLALRTRVMRVGALIRDRSVAAFQAQIQMLYAGWVTHASNADWAALASAPPVPGGFVAAIGPTIVEWAAVNAAGINDPGTNGRNYVFDEPRKMTLQHERYLRFLREHHAEREAAWAASVLAGQKYPQSPTSGEIQRRYGLEYTLWELLYRWQAGLLLISECIVFALIGGFMAQRCYIHRFDFALPRPLSPAVVAGSIAAIVMVVSALLFVSPHNNDNIVFILVLPLLAGVLLPLLSLIPAARIMASSYLLHLVCLLGLIGPLLWQLGGMVDLLTLEGAFKSLRGDGSLLETVSVAAPFALQVLAIPAGLAVLLALANRVRGVPVAAGVARGFHALALPTLTLLLLAYVALTFSTAQLETSAQRSMERYIGARGAEAERRDMN